MAESSKICSICLFHGVKMEFKYILVGRFGYGVLGDEFVYGGGGDVELIKLMAEKNNESENSNNYEKFENEDVPKWFDDAFKHRKDNNNNKNEKDKNNENYD
eukprot:31871_1